jgi:hypothetical protein
MAGTVCRELAQRSLHVNRPETGARRRTGASVKDYARSAPGSGLCIARSRSATVSVPSKEGESLKECEKILSRFLGRGWNKAEVDDAFRSL